MIKKAFWKGFEKVAVLGLAANAAKTLVGAAVRNPGTTLSAGLTGLTLASDAKSGAEMAAKNSGSRQLNTTPMGPQM